MLTWILCAITVGFLAFPSLCCATKITREPIEELLRHADYVGLVRIESGETLWVGDKICGAKYRGVVLDGIKGVAARELLEWNTFAGLANSTLEIGTSYLVFLTKPGKRYDPLGSTNSSSEKRKIEFEEVCHPALRSNRVIHTGNGILKVEVPMLGRSSIVAAQWDEIVRIPSMAIRLPKTLDSIPVEEKGQEVFAYKDVWVQLKHLVSYLKLVNR